jgi:hypothetical protein
MNSNNPDWRGQIIEHFFKYLGTHVLMLLIGMLGGSILMGLLLSPGVTFSRTSDGGFTFKRIDQPKEDFQKKETTKTQSEKVEALESANSVIESFYLYIAREDYTQAWDMLSPHYKKAYEDNIEKWQEEMSADSLRLRKIEPRRETLITYYGFSSGRASFKGNTLRRYYMLVLNKDGKWLVNNVCKENLD